MGYRNYIGSLPKKEYEQIKNFTKEELFKFKGETDEDPQMNHVGVYDIAYNEIYALGKYVDEFPKEFFKPVFLNKELQKYFADEHDFYLVGKEFLAKVIECYGDKVREIYEKMISPFFDEQGNPSDFLNAIKSEYKSGPGLDKDYTFDFSNISQGEQNGLKAMIEHVKSMGAEWGVRCWMENRRPYNLEKEGIITHSWMYEYAQFQLVHIYKTFDWDNNVVIYYGY